jgi:hypothetical protein|uniref:Uncharacterized protein n=1 Tax=viral metagenome TaxID=1070528 RepID=A0A6C0DVZ4_9ZZZZ
MSTPKPISTEEQAHFSFSRSLYDDCSLQKKNQESVAPFEWTTDSSIIESKQSCYLAASPFMHNPFNSVPSSIVDIESDLKGQTRQLSKCPETRFNPNTAKALQWSKLPECTNTDLVPEYTRLNRSCNVLSEITINRFNPLCNNPQESNKIHSNEFIGTNTRLQIKDAFKVEQDKYKKSFL